MGDHPDIHRDGPWTISGNLVDPLRRSIRPATLTIADGRIEAIADDPVAHPTWLLPGFVDAHVHVESSLLPPAEFARLAVAHGTVATVSDPHEIANVLGIPGVEFMLDDARQSPFTFHFGAPSCVPATPFDHAGAVIDAAGVAALLDRPEIGYLSEMMNYPGVIAGDEGVLAKIAAAKARGKPVDGHAPRVRGAAAAAYVASGITTDHECVDLDEAVEKIGLGMKILIREGSAARNFDALASLIDSHPDRVMLCSDDKHPDQLLLGHIDQLVRRARARGSDLFDALQAACVNPVRHYGLPVGLLQPGDRGDFLEVDDLEALRIRRVFVKGRLAAADGVTVWPRVESLSPNRFDARSKRPDDFAIASSSAAPTETVRVIEALDGQLVTGSVRLPVPVADGRMMADPANDVLKIAVVDRYDDRPPAVAFIRNVGLRRGAIASSVSHDSHNIVAVGATDTELTRAVNLVIESRGGLSVAGPDGDAVLPLPIAGLMSNRPGQEVAAAYSDIDRRAKALGSRLAAPYMTLSFMALLVIPSLKVGPMGLFDVDAFRPVGLTA
ncbi:MAG: adenine deaminase [Planctomycetes bacterium]|nr:adenine deaminase [Planctomycetota bacterium]